MAANSPFLRPFGIAAGVLGSFQAITWGILSLLGILVHSEAIEMPTPETESDYFQMVLVHMYLYPTDADSFIMPPKAVAVWTSLYFATSVIWLVISGFLLYDSCKSKFTSKIIIGWVAVSAVIAAIDFAGTVAFGVDYSKLQIELDNYNIPVPYGTVYLLAPIFMMFMCARGFTLWIIKVGLVIYLGAAASKLCKKNYPKHRHPGWNMGSVGYRADDGKIFIGSGVGDPFVLRCHKGDRMGCGIVLRRDYMCRYDRFPIHSKNGRMKIVQNSIEMDAKTKESKRNTKEKQNGRNKEGREQKKPKGRPVERFGSSGV